MQEEGQQCDHVEWLEPRLPSSIQVCFAALWREVRVARATEAAGNVALARCLEEHRREKARMLEQIQRTKRLAHVACSRLQRQAADATVGVMQLVYFLIAVIVVLVAYIWLRVA